MEKSQLLEFSKKIVVAHLESKTIHVLSKKTGISRSYLHHLGKGKIINPGIRQVECILKAAELADFSVFFESLGGVLDA